MSPEQLEAARKAEDALSPEEKAKRKKFHICLMALRDLIKILAEKQRKLRLQRKPSRGAVNKSRYDALRITVMLIVMREMKGLSLTYTMPELRCRDKRCNSVIRPAQQRFVHNVREEDLGAARRLREELRVNLDLHAFIEENK